MQLSDTPFDIPGECCFLIRWTMREHLDSAPYMLFIVERVFLIFRKTVVRTLDMFAAVRG